MANGIIGNNPDEMRNGQTRLNTEASNLEAIRTKITEYVNNEIPVIWNGNSANAYIGQWNEIQQSFVKAEDVLRTLGEQLGTAATNQEEVDRANGGR